MEKGGEAADNGDEEPIEIVGKKRSNVIRDEPKTCIEGTSTDEPEAADLAADSAPEDDAATDLPDVCLEFEAAALTHVATSALPAYWELPSGMLSNKSSLFDREITHPMQAPIARYMKDEDSQRSEDAQKFPRVVEHTVTGDESESEEEQECGLIKGTG